MDGHKGTTLLAEYFARYKERHPGPLRLVLAGPVVDAPPTHPDVDVLGPVSEEEKWALLSEARALVSPSPWEAFSLVVAEAWSARTPVLVNAGCAATVEHCRRSGGGVTFAGYGEFEVAVDRLVGDPDFGQALGRRGRAYVDARFRWPHVVARYAAFVESVVARDGGRRRRPVGGDDAGAERSGRGAVGDRTVGRSAQSVAERPVTGHAHDLDPQDVGPGCDPPQPVAGEGTGPGDRARPSPGRPGRAGRAGRVGR